MKLTLLFIAALSAFAQQTTPVKPAEPAPAVHKIKPETQVSLLIHQLAVERAGMVLQNAQEALDKEKSEMAPVYAEVDKQCAGDVPTINKGSTEVACVAKPKPAPDANTGSLKAK